MNSMTLNKIAAAVLLAGVVAMSTGLVTRLIHPAAAGGHGGDHHGDEQRVLAAYVQDDATASAVVKAPAGPEPIAGLLASADLDLGKKVFKKCGTCHTVDKGGPDKIGPALYGIVGNDIASHGGFAYSGVLQDLPGNWTYAELNAFLYKPKEYAKGTKMTFAGLRKATDRAALIAYLRAQDDAPEALPE